MKIYHVETQQAYDELMIEIEKQGYKWLSGRKPTSRKYWEQEKKNTCIKISGKFIVFMNIERCKKQHPNVPIIEYKAKAKGEKMTQEEMKQKEMKQKEMKHNIFDLGRDISVSIESFARGISKAEADLKEAKSSAKKLIENIDDYLESQKPKIKVGDYVTVDVNDRKIIAKIDALRENKKEAHGLWYDKTKVNVKQDYWFLAEGNEFRHARPTEIEEYVSALTFHNHGRNPFEVKKGDILRDDEGNILINDDNILSANFPKNLKKHYFTSGKYTLLKTVEEYNEWLKTADEVNEWL